MKVSELKTEMDGKFAAVDVELKELRQLIASDGDASRRHVNIVADTIRRHLDEVVSARIRSEGETTRRHLDEVVSARIRSEGETTRRHFDVVAEKMLSERNLSLDRSMATAQQLAGLTASNAADQVRLERRLDDHERRLENIERGQEADSQ